MYSSQPTNCKGGSRLTGVHSFLVMLLGLLAVSAVQAQTYNWKQVQIHGGGFVTGILFHPNEPGLMYCRTDIGGSYRWNPTNDTWIPLLDFVGYPNNEWSLIGTESIGLDAQDTEPALSLLRLAGQSQPDHDLHQSRGEFHANQFPVCDPGQQ